MYAKRSHFSSDQSHVQSENGAAVAEKRDLLGRRTERRVPDGGAGVRQQLPQLPQAERSAPHLLPLRRPQSQLRGQVFLASLRQLQALLLLLLLRLQPEEVQPHVRGGQAHSGRVQDDRTIAVRANQIRVPMAGLQADLRRGHPEEARNQLHGAAETRLPSGWMRVDRKTGRNGESTLQDPRKQQVDLTQRGAEAGVGQGFLFADSGQVCAGPIRS